ncbi:N-acetylmuramoyl-L-alanine amidase [Bordetella genomosp. 9]|uniref:N-acetylmuramoyl-L-alanine amidase n=1 Tax=Bordetella genomosp. 9 TaxID=1416803 RepID=UPI000A28DF8A|nr:N-acetylmuramoyl-L-alanine amidase [Bordetella genomosp. 9]ARP91335.1 N-acetylmuramoyl-L-alanine amidase [Bordetella genomosp. 9]
MARGLIARCGCAALALCVAAALAGCAPTYPQGLKVDRSVSASAQDSRIRFIVLHYTSMDDHESLLQLSRGNVSAHYLVTEADRVQVYQLVPERRNAWHAGPSSWFGHTSVNNASIGIEIVNPGYEKGPDGSLRWTPYTEAQIRTVIALVADIARRHGVRPENIVGHADVAPQRKVDPGPAFPWKRLAMAGLGRWYDEAAAQTLQGFFEKNGVPDASWFQSQLARVGYDAPRTGVFDEATRRVIAAFQMHYRPQICDGLPDAGTAAALLALPAHGSAMEAGAAAS